MVDLLFLNELTILGHTNNVKVELHLWFKIESKHGNKRTSQMYYHR